MHSDRIYARLYLDYAHQQHVIHRDVKPENMLLNANDEVVLSDFGLAVVQRSLDSLSTQNPAGTPQYMAPEQIRGKPTAASDQYALGVLVYEWLCGEPPFRGSLIEVLSQHLHQPPPSLCARIPSLPLAVEDAIFGALAKESHARFASVQDFANVLEEVYDGTQSLSLALPSKGLSQEQISPSDTQPISTQVSSPQEQDQSSSTQPRVVAQQRTEEKEDLMELEVPLLTSQKRASSQQKVVPVSRTNRQRLLRKVYAYWIAGVFEHSLHGAALIALGLQEQPDAIANPWQLVLQHPAGTPHSLPAGTHIKEVYDAADGELLILGAPGSGKTTLLLELARDLLARAEQDEQHPLPVVFNLSSWARKQQHLTDWLVEELSVMYQVPRKLGRAWVDGDQILPLLDGLDEVAPKERTACIGAINTYRQEHGLLPLVVCSRSADYLAQIARVQLGSAVMVQPLTEQQVDDYLACGGEPLRALRVALQQDAELRELTNTPLMLSILTLTYHGLPIEELVQGAFFTDRQHQVFKHYVDRMLSHRGTETHYTKEQTMQWLSWLAQRMKQHGQTEFYIEQMQPDWLPDRQSRRLYSGILGGLLVGLPIALVIWLFFGLLAGLFTGLLVGPLVGLLSLRNREIKTAEVISWSWVKMPQDLFKSFIIALVGLLFAVLGLTLVNLLVERLIFEQFGPRFGGLISLLVIGLVGLLIFGLVGGLVSSLVDRFSRQKPGEHDSIVSSQRMQHSVRKGVLMGLVVAVVVELLIVAVFRLLGGVLIGLPVIGVVSGLIVGLIFGLVNGFSSQKLDKHYLIVPNQAIRRSARNGVLVGLVVGLVSGLIVGLISGVVAGFDRQTSGLFVGLMIGLVTGLVSGMVGGLLNGGIAFIEHFVLRLLLWRSGSIPWNYSRFLDYAAESILLRKVGGGYIFIHRLLLEHFVELDTLPPMLNAGFSSSQPTGSTLEIFPSSMSRRAAITLPLPTKKSISPGRSPLSKRRISRRELWFGIILALTLFSIMGGGFFSSIIGLGRPIFTFGTAVGFSRSSVGTFQGGSGRFSTETFTVNALPTLVVNDQYGSIHVHLGSTDHVVAITDMEVFSGNLNNEVVSYAPNGNTINVSVDKGAGSSNVKSVDFDVTVPSHANLQLKTGFGGIVVSGISGQMSLTTVGGSINATQDTLSGQSSLKTNSGPITFDSFIDPRGTYQFETQSGSVTVILPSNSTFHLNAKTDSGSINTGDFPGVKVQKTINGSQAYGDVGTFPQATVILITKSGSIDLYKKVLP